MAFGDNATDYADCDTAIIKFYRLHPAPAQFTRMGATSKWFRPRVDNWVGNRYNFNLWHTPFTGTRQSDFATAATAAFPASMDISQVWYSYAYTDLSMFQASVKFSLLTVERTKSRKDAVYSVAKRMFQGVNSDYTEKLNTAIHTNSACVMAVLEAIYAVAGGAYGSNRRAYFKIKSGSIGNFHKGMVIKTDNTESLTVLDVIYGDDGPWSGGTRVSSIGPGITVDAGSGLTVDSSNDDVITRSGETTDDSFHGFADWFSGTTNVYKDEDGNAIDRDNYGEAWGIPYIHTAAAAGSEVTLDLDTHLRPIANNLVYQVAVADQKSREEGLSIPSAMVALTTPEICNEAVQEASGSQRWTSASLGSMDAAKRKELFGQVGFKGMVVQFPTLGPIAFEADKAAAPFKIRMIKPSTWFWLAMGNGPENLRWVPNASGGKLHPVVDVDSTGRNTFYVQSACWTSMLLVCDQMRANVEITGVTDSV